MAMVIIRVVFGLGGTGKLDRVTRTPESLKRDGICLD